MVTGGFHTTGLKQRLQEKDIPFIVVTPAITEDTVRSEQRYSELALQQAHRAVAAVRSMDGNQRSLALTVASQVSSPELFKAALESVTRDLQGQKLDRVTLDALLAALSEASGIERESLSVEYNENTQRAVITFPGGNTMAIESTVSGITATGNIIEKVLPSVHVGIAAVKNTLKATLITGITVASVWGMVVEAYPVYKNAMLFAEKHGLVFGEGLISTLETVPERVDGIEKDVLANLPKE